MRPESHISDEELMQAIDDELTGRRKERVERHLSHCWHCRARRGEFERAIRAFVRLEATAAQIPPIEGPAARLRASLGELAGQPPARRPIAPMAAIAICAIVIATVGAGLYRSSLRPASSRGLPDARLTPGATRFISAERVCSAGVTDDDHPIPAELAQRVFHQYNIERPRPKAYEVDYLITPTLGGADDIRNLWPQLYEDGIWNSRVKDALEDRLRDLVCTGKLELATAQHEIASDWIAAYRKYFHTDRPLPAHALFLKDHPWE